MKKDTSELPSIEAMEAELKRVKDRSRFARILKSTVYTLITVAAVAVLIATLWMPVLHINGNSMAPTLHDGNIVLSVKDSDPEIGDVIAFYYNNKILVKRVIAGPGDWVNISEDGTVSVNGQVLEEPYLSEKALGDCDIELPYQVPAAKYFVMGDHRNVSADSRNTAVGCVAQEQIVGRIIFCVWPLSEFGSAG